MSGAQRLPIVGVMGSGREEHRDRAEPLGAWLARRGVHLLTGGGGGVMSAVSRGFVQVPAAQRSGRVLGVLPGGLGGELEATPEGYPNPWVEIPIRTHLPDRGARGAGPRSRNAINVLTSDLLVALPGGEGTSSEIRLAVEVGRPVVAYLDRREEIPHLPDVVEHCCDLASIEVWLEDRLARWCDDPRGSSEGRRAAPYDLPSCP